MSAGMAEVIATYPGHEIRPDDQLWVQVCFGCPWRYRYSNGSGLEAHSVHVAEELGKAGYGNVQEAGQQLQGATKKLRDANRKLRQLKAVVQQASLYGSVECDELDAIIDGVWSPTPGPLAAALADPEGHALVKAIHDRKAEG